jgi:hypothetical protein
MALPHPSFPVIPAKAGIQTESVPFSWIPAVAGTTSR